MLIRDEYPQGSRSYGACDACGAARRDGEKIVDFEITIDMEGYLMICGTCVASAARELGWRSEKESTKSALELADAKEENIVLKAKVSDLTNLADAVKKATEQDAVKADAS